MYTFKEYQEDQKLQKQMDIRLYLVEHPTATYTELITFVPTTYHQVRKYYKILRS